MNGVAVLTRGMRVLTLAIAASLPAIATSPASLAAQVTTRDSTSQLDSARARKLERVMISAVRESAAPISQKTVTQAQIQQHYFGQDIPLVLQGTTPSLTSYAETGNYWGYSYIRLRGIDQSRINITIDGIPLNDPEDQVLYFADFPDLANTLQSIQVQRGVGTSSNGTASYAGSINMETMSLADAPRGGDVQLEGGSFGSRRASVDYNTGALANHLAFYGRVSALHTDGYRYHSGVEGTSGFLSGGYFGDHDILKFTAIAGLMRDTMAYLAVPEADLAVDRRINPLSPRERDGFGERLLSLAYTRLLDANSSISTTLYRLSATGDYDVLLDSLETLHLDFVSYGVMSAWSYHHNGMKLDLGVNADTYARDHYAFMHPDLANALYFNTGHKQDQAGFAKLAYVAGRATLFGDVQVRHAEFMYTPDANADIAGSSISWTFLNPKAGITYQVTRPLSIYASYGETTREPARTNMFAGFDNLDTSNVAFVGQFNRVKPESVHDIELGSNFRSENLDVQADLYSMDFQNEIAPIGALSYIGNPLSKNVASSYRRGIEADVSYRGIPRWLLSANATESMNRIRAYTDSTGDVPITYRNVEPLLTPRFQSFGRAEFSATPALDLAIQGRYQSVAFLQNTSDRRYVLPAAFDMDASIGWRIGRNELLVRANNLTDSKKYGSGYASDGVSYYYVLPPRNFFVTLKVGI
ncbi:MAG TPA: TonB-dependent receptor [Gemmatimonadaceae bacterium]|jgi:iron complex outermembrane receptor protein